MAHQLLIKEWLFKSEQDFGFAKFGLKQEKKYYDQICFFFHQSAEKCFKAYIVKFDLKFEKEHRLIKLLQICEVKDLDFRRLQEDCEFLDHFYFEARYPDPVFAVFTKKDAKKAFQSALKIQKFIKDKLGIKSKVTLEELKIENKKIDKILKNKIK